MPKTAQSQCLNSCTFWMTSIPAFVHAANHSQVTDWTCCFIQSQPADTGLTSPRSDLIAPYIWQGSHQSTSFKTTGLTHFTPSMSQSTPSVYQTHTQCTRHTRHFLTHSSLHLPCPKTHQRSSTTHLSLTLFTTPSMSQNTSAFQHYTPLLNPYLTRKSSESSTVGPREPRLDLGSRPGRFREL